MYTVINASDDQINAFYEKHMKPKLSIGFFGKKIPIGGVMSSSAHYCYDDEDNIGFFSISTISGKRIGCQVRGETPCFVELTGFGSIRYDIAYPERRENCQEFYAMLKDLANKAKVNFWKGGEI